jgi:tRNA threonylcarbamoyladenosine biosynthesis protein TsaE
MLMEFETEEEMLIWGRERGKSLGENDLVFLYGVLGAGKTSLVRALAGGYGVDENEVRSPTYNLHHQMQTREGKTVHHIDGYRLGDSFEYEQLGLDFLPSGLTFVEWPELFPKTPTLILKIAIKVDKRSVEII